MNKLRLYITGSLALLIANIGLAISAHGQLSSDTLLVKPTPVIDSLQFSCTTGNVQVLSATTPATYYVTGITPADIALPEPNSTGSFNLAGATAAVFNVVASNGCASADTSITFDCGPLPISLLDFKVSLYEKDKGLATWRINEDGAISHYELEESQDAQHFTYLSTIQSYGLPTDPAAYSYTDNTLWKGFNYYRLKIFRLDGSYIYSPVRSLFLDMANIRVVFYPNPTKGSVFAEVDADMDDNLTLEVKDGLSRVMIPTEKHPIKAGKNVFEINLNGLADGTYIFQYQLPKHNMAGSDRIIKSN